MKRPLTLLVLLGPAAFITPTAAAAKATAPSARLTVSRTVVGSAGGPVVVRARVHDGRRCTWYARPTVPAFAEHGPCSPKVLNRVARLPRNPLHHVRRFVFRLAVSDAYRTITKTIAVGQLAAPQPTTTATASLRSCTPLSNEGTCYEPGEFCRNSDHGVTGVAGDGETIACKDNNGWRWEPLR